MGDRELVVAECESDDIADRTVEYHESTGSFRTEFDYQTRHVSEAVILGVAHVTNQDPVSLPPLFDAIDPDSLNHLFSTQAKNTPPDGLSVSFEYADQTVTVHGHGTVEIMPPY